VPAVRRIQECSQPAPDDEGRPCHAWMDSTGVQEKITPWKQSEAGRELEGKPQAHPSRCATSAPIPSQA
jgi:hypothetical protein